MKFKQREMELLQVWKGLTARQGTYDAQYALSRNMMREG